MQMLNGKSHDLSMAVNNLVGQEAWDVKLGHGSFITMEFGKPTKGKMDLVPHGEWHLWIYMCSWRIEEKGAFIAGCEDPRGVMIDAVQRINGSKLKCFEILTAALDVALIFDNDVVVKLFSIYSDCEDNEGSDHWKLYMPDNKVLVAGPGSKWKIEEQLDE